jgi:uncharacterized protein YcbX
MTLAGPAVHVRSLHVYPVKGARGIALQRAEVLASGIRNDRRFMVLDAKDTFVTQRRHPRMALVDVAISGEELLLGGAKIPLCPDGPRRTVRVWNDDVEAVDVGGDGAAFFSDWLGERCSLVFIPADVIRPVEEPYSQPGDRVGFADAYPLLVASLASLADLNARLKEPVRMDRFRPNIVFEGGEPWAEDHAATMQIGNLALRTPKPCARCEVTTIDQATAARGKEPLRTLATYRSFSNKVLFAMNAIPELAADEATFIAVGDAVTLTASAAATATE